MVNKIRSDLKKHQSLYLTTIAYSLFETLEFVTIVDFLSAWVYGIVIHDIHRQY